MVSTQVATDAGGAANARRVVALRLDPATAQRVERAARLTQRSPGAFVRWAADLAARSVVLEDAAQRYRRGERSLSELADETGLAVEELMDAVAAAGGVDDELDAAPGMFLASIRSAAEAHGVTNLLRLASETAREAQNRQ